MKRIYLDISQKSSTDSTHGQKKSQEGLRYSSKRQQNWGRAANSESDSYRRLEVLFYQTYEDITNYKGIRVSQEKHNDLNYSNKKNPYQQAIVENIKLLLIKKNISYQFIKEK